MTVLTTGHCCRLLLKRLSYIQTGLHRGIVWNPYEKATRLYMRNFELSSYEQASVNILFTNQESGPPVGKITATWKSNTRFVGVSTGCGGDRVASKVLGP